MRVIQCVCMVSTVGVCTACAYTVRVRCACTVCACTACVCVAMVAYQLAPDQEHTVLAVVDEDLDELRLGRDDVRAALAPLERQNALHAQVRVGDRPLHPLVVSDVVARRRLGLLAALPLLLRDLQSLVLLHVLLLLRALRRRRVDPQRRVRRRRLRLLPLLDLLLRVVPELVPL